MITRLKFDPQNIAVEHTFDFGSFGEKTIELENIEVILERAEAILKEKRESIDESDLSEDILRYYNVDQQLNMKVYTDVEIGYKNMKDEFFYGDDNDLTVGVLTFDVNTKALTDETQQYLDDYFSYSNNLVSSWNALADVLREGTPKYIRDTGNSSYWGGGSLLTSKYAITFDNHESLKQNIAELYEGYKLHNSDVIHMIEYSSLLDNVLSNASNNVEAKTKLLEYFNQRSLFINSKETVYDHAGYAAVVYKNNHNLNDENIIAPGFISRHQYNSQKKAIDDLGNFVKNTTFSIALGQFDSWVKNQIELRGTVIDQMLHNRLKRVDTYINLGISLGATELMDYAIGITGEVVTKEDFINDLKYINTELTNKVANIDEQDYDEETKQMLEFTSKMVATVVSVVVSSSAIVGAVVGAFLYGVTHYALEQGQKADFHVKCVKYMGMLDSKFNSGDITSKEDILEWIAPPRKNRLTIDMENNTNAIVADGVEFNQVNGNGNSNSIMIKDGNNNVAIGQGGDDILYGSENDDFIYGDFNFSDMEFISDSYRWKSNIGNDILVGGKGTDFLEGGYGDDTYIFLKGDGNDTISDYMPENHDENTIDIYGYAKKDIYLDVVESTEGHNGFDLIIKFYDTNESILVKRYYNNNEYFGSYSYFKSISVDGSQLQSSNASDANDLISFATGVDEKLGTDGYDVIIGNQDNNNITGLDGNDTIYGHKGNDYIKGGDGRDQLYGGNDTDTLLGGDENDILDGGSGNDTLDGGDGDDILIHTEGKDELKGNLGSDNYIIKGSSFDNLVIDETGSFHLKGSDNDKVYLLDSRFSDVMFFRDKGTSDLKIYTLNDNTIESMTIKGVFKSLSGSSKGVRTGKSVKEVVLKDAVIDLSKIPSIYLNDSRQEEYHLALDENGDVTIVYTGFIRGDIKGYIEDKTKGQDLGDAVSWSNKPNDLDILDPSISLSNQTARTEIDLGNFNIDNITVRIINNDIYLDANSNRFVIKNDRTLENKFVKVTNEDGSEFQYELSQLISNLDTKYESVDLNGVKKAFNYYETTIEIDDNKVEFAHGAYIKNGRTLVSAKEMVLQLGGSITWDNETKIAHITFGDKTGKIDFRNQVYYVDDVRKSLKVDSEIVVTKIIGTDYTLMAHIGAIVEIMGLGVSWNSSDSIVEVSTNGEYTAVDEVEYLGEIIYATPEQPNVFGTNGNDTIYGNTNQNSLHGGQGDDVIHAGNENDVIYGSEGADTLYGELGSDKLYGGSGDDALYGGSGDDYLEGGAGNDYLEGGLGSDTYVLKRGFGDIEINDKVMGSEFNDNNSYDRIVFKDIDLSEVVFSQNKENLLDLIISVKGTNDKILIKDYYISQYFDYLVESIAFADGKLLTKKELRDIATLEDNLHKDCISEDLKVTISEEWEINNDQFSLLLDFKLGTFENDVIYGGKYLDGKEGNDQLHGEKGNDFIAGGSGDDTIYGGEGNDTIYGGTGIDYLDGGAGSDIYLFKKGFDNAIINNFALDSYKHQDVKSNDKIKFTDVEMDEISFRIDEENLDDLIISVNSTDDEIRIKNYFAHDYYQIELIEFSDGKILSKGELNSLISEGALVGTAFADQIIGSNIDNIIKGNDGNDILKGNEGNDQLFGGAGDDELYGGSGDDILHGGLGQDILNGGYGNDVYILEKGFGKKEIIDYATQKISGGPIDTRSFDMIKFEDVLLEDVTFAKDLSNLNDLLIRVESTQDEVRIVDYYKDKYSRIEGIEFANGKLVQGNDLNDLTGVSRNSDDEIIIAESDGKVLKGGDGNDIYVVSKGIGDVIIEENSASLSIDVLRFLDVSKNEVKFEGDPENPSDLVIRIVDTDDTVIIKRFYDSKNCRIEKIEFFDGSELGGEELLDIITNMSFMGTDLNDTLKGNYTDNHIIGNAGNDTIIGDKGNDHLVGGSGNDLIYGGTGNDLLEATSGDTSLFGEEGDDTLHAGIGKTYLNGGLGDDIYVIKKGVGLVEIDDSSSESSFDTIVFSDVVRDEVQFEVDQNLPWNLVIRVIDTNDLIYVKHPLVGRSRVSFKKGGVHGENKLRENNSINKIVFSDGFELSGQSLLREVNKFEINGELHDDDLNGSFMDDLINGLSGNDKLNGSLGNDVIYGGNGNDVIYGENGDDILEGGDGDDTIYGGFGYDYLIAGNGEDQLYGEAGDDILEASSGISYLYGGAGYDVLIAGQGDSFLEGGELGDTYVFSKGFGNAEINDYNEKASVDIIKFTDVNREEVVFKHDSEAANNLVIKIVNCEDKITIKNFFVGKKHQVDKIIFADDSELFGEQLIDVANNFKIIGSENDDVLSGSSVDDKIIGYDGDDVIIANGGNDILDGGMGNDVLVGGSGTDDYIFEGLFGKNEIRNTASLVSDNDSIIFNDLKIFDVRFEVDNNKITIYDRFDSNNSVSYSGFRNSQSIITEIKFKDRVLSANQLKMLVYEIEEINYSSFIYAETMDGVKGSDAEEYIIGSADNNVLNGGRGNDYLLGKAGDDVLNGDLGNDILEGGVGNDTYIFNETFGTDEIRNNGGLVSDNDKIIFTELNTYDVQFKVNDEAIIIYDRSNNENNVIINGFINDENNIVSVQFNNVTLTSQQIILLADEAMAHNYHNFIYANLDQSLNGSISDDYIIGHEFDNDLKGSLGNDYILGHAGNDILNGEVGNDILIGGSGSDSYIFSDEFGSDEIMSIGSLKDDHDTIFFEDLNIFDVKFEIVENTLIIADKSNYDNQVKIHEFFDEINAISFIQFKDLTITYDQILENAEAADKNGFNSFIFANTLLSVYGSFSDYIIGNEENNLIYGSHGNDYLLGKKGDDKLYGGSGNDILEGGAGDDSYIFRGLFGSNEVRSDNVLTTDQDKIIFSDLKSSDVRFERSDNVVTIYNRLREYDNVRIIDMLDSNNAVKSVEFTDIVLSMQQIRTFFENADDQGYNGFVYVNSNLIFNGTSANDCIVGNDANNNIYGNTGSDYLSGNGGNDTLSGGLGDDLLQGGLGNDTYVFNGDFGFDTVSDKDSISSEEDRLVFNDLSINEVRFKVIRNNVMIYDKSNEDNRVDVYGLKDSNSSIKIIEFNDSILTSEELRVFIDEAENYGYSDFALAYSSQEFNGTSKNDFIIGDNSDNNIKGGIGSDYLVGGKGDDILQGGEGEDTYIFKNDFGSDTVITSFSDQNDRLIFNDLSLFDVKFKYLDDGIHIIDQINSNNQVKLVVEHGPKFILPELMFSNASLSNREIMEMNMMSPRIKTMYYAKENQVIIGDNSSEAIFAKGDGITIHGNDGDDYLAAMVDYMNPVPNEVILNGGNGNDQIRGGFGNDLLNGGDGHDSISDGVGNDIVNAGAGDDYISCDEGDDVYNGGSGNDTFDFWWEYNEDYITGADTISQDGAGINDLDKLVFMDINLAHVKFEISGENIVLKLLDETGNQITIQDFLNEKNRIDRFEFNDVTISSTEIIDYCNQAIENGAGSVLFGSEYFRTINGDNNGNLMIGSNASEEFNGHSGHDIITAGHGDDALNGGLGNDILDGGLGDDTYIFGDQFGSDTINQNDVTGSDKVIFENHDMDAFNFAYTGDDLVISSKTTTDQLLIKSFNTSINQVDSFNFNGMEKIKSDIDQLIQAMATGDGGSVPGLNGGMDPNLPGDGDGGVIIPSTPQI